ncbi:MAG: pirin family protein [Bacteroidia bacterium]|nr:pirin family protein [Bacteroidia bacterium]
MDRKKFLRTGLAGAAALGCVPLITAGSGKEETEKELPQAGFNHLPNKKDITMNTVLHTSDSRGHASHGWLESRHTFSFANYYNPERTHFGVLRVLNDDIVQAGKGFGTHPHDNMEIISIPLYGDLEHKDSMGNSTVIREGDIQVMSAGTGIFHSEYNKNADKEVRFLQIWLFPDKKNVKPRYDQVAIRDLYVKNELVQVLSPNENDKGVWINQRAWFHMGDLDAGLERTYTLKDATNGIYAFMIEGEAEIAGQKLGKRDGLGIWDASSIQIKTLAASKILLMEVPMHM